MNSSALTTLISLRPLRQWFARWLALALPQPTACASHANPRAPASAPPPISARLCSPACAMRQPTRAPHHPPSKFFATVQQWLNEQPKPHTLVVYVDPQTTQITQLKSLSSAVAHKLITTPAYNSPDTEWVQINPHYLRRKNCEAATLFGQQEFCLSQLEDMLAARWYASESLATLHNRTLRAFEIAFPAEEDIASISIKQRQAALAQFKALLPESNKAIQEILLLDDALIPALHMLGVEVPDEIRQRKQVLHPSQV